MTFEETVRGIVREELAALEERLAARAPAAAAPAGADRLLSPEAAAELFGYSPETFKTWARQGRLKRYGTPRRARFSEAEIRALLAGGVKAGKPSPTDAQILELARERAARR